MVQGENSGLLAVKPRYCHNPSQMSCNVGACCMALSQRVLAPLNHLLRDPLT
jgi:hypothetical protein